MVKKTLATKLAELIRRTEGFTVELKQEGYRFKNVETGQAATLHESVDSPSVMVYQEKRLAKTLGWTRELYEEQQASSRAGRVARAQRVEHRINSYIEGQTALEAREDDMSPEEAAKVAERLRATKSDTPTIHTVITAAPTFGIGDVARWETGGCVFTITLEAITKSIAEDYLSKIGDINPETGHRAQRKRMPTHIADLARRINRGEFGLSPDMVVFNESGELINGQHRLSALMASGLGDDEPLLFLVTRCWPRDTFYRIDHGKSRSMKDALFLRGEKYAVALSTVLRDLYMIDNVPQGQWNQFTLSDELGLMTLDRNPGVRESATWANRASTIKANKNGLWLAHYLITRANPAEAHGAVDDWFDRLIEGYDLGRNEPVTKLRRWFLAADDRRMTEAIRKASPRLVAVYVTIKQWNNTQLGKTLKGNPVVQVPFVIPKPLKFVPPPLRPEAGEGD